ncbi:MAG: hypothetical protein RIN56_18815 [Sporomusaceae bacterium]|nr:hypothetical protein [Sporomusaceae bacterium]
MELKDVINILFFGGLIFFMMRFGCCGGHRHGGLKHEGQKGGCCGGKPAEKRSDAKSDAAL